jgi:hypothetical protein
VLGSASHLLAVRDRPRTPLRSSLSQWRAPSSAGVRRVVAYPPLCDMSDLQRREFHEAVLDADTFEDLPGKWQAAILKAEENRPNLRIVGSD